MKNVSLDPLVSLLESDMAAVNTRIIERLQSETPLIPEIAGHLIAAGGKRIRPMMTLAGAKLGGGNDKAVSLATAVEFIHTATLLHDDVIDESALRRGKDTANMLWGNDASVLVGDFLFARAFELMVEAGDIAVLGRLANASASITQGEIKQLEITGTPDTSEEEYIEVISGKTAVLFAAAAAAGASISGAPEKQVAAMHDYGMQLGLAFQIMDDAMDYTVSSTKMGKNSGDDFFERKITLPFILAWQEGSSKERAFWSRTIGEGDFIDGDLKKAQNIIEKHHAIDQSVKIAGGYAQAAISALDPLRSRDEISLQLTGALTSTALFAASRQN